MRCVWVAMVTMLLAAPAWAAGRLIIVVGAEGEPEYGRQFNAWADRWAAAAKGALQVEQIGRGPVDGSGTPATLPSPSTAPSTQAVSDKDRLRVVLRTAADEADGPLWLVLIGHGTADERGAKFNLRGPDVSDVELTEWLKPVKRPVAVIDCSSASGPFLPRVSAANRVTVVATRSGSEHQFARFGDMLSAAVIDPAADLDKDGQTSLLEAFLVASGRVDALYTAAGRLVTEHALLDDTGDGRGLSADAFQGTRLKRPTANNAADGVRANQWVLRPVEKMHSLAPETQAKCDELEAAVEALRAKKSSLSEDQYYRQLERLMIDLAKLEP